jgi:uncharacterized membrane protein YbhN (UPF0104 family)
MSSRLGTFARSIWFRLAVTAGLLGIVAAYVDWSSVEQALSEADWHWFAAAIGLLAGGLLVGAFRWQALLRGAAVESSPLSTLRAYLLGMLTNTFLPTGFGGDALRAVLVGRSRARLVRTVTSVVADRATALACLIAVAWIAVALDPGAVPVSLVVALAILTAGGLAAGSLLVVLVRRAGSGNRPRPGRLRAWAEEVRTVAATYGRDVPLLAVTSVSGVAYQVLVVFSVLAVAQAIDVELSFAVVAVTLPLVLVLTLLPISIGGFGVREAAFVVLLGKAGVDASDAVLISLLGFVAMTAAALPGVLLIPVRGGEPLRRSAEASVERLVGIGRASPRERPLDEVAGRPHRQRAEAFVADDLEQRRRDRPRI